MGADRATSHGKPPVIGLTGGIGAGKSHVASLMAEAGCQVFDADAQAQSLLDTPEVRDAIQRRFGPQSIDAQGLVNRRVVADRVFQHPEDRQVLESILHPRVALALEEAMGCMPQTIRAMVIDAPLLLEADLDHHCDTVIFIEAPIEARVDRVIHGRGWTQEDLARREAAQFELDAKRERSHHVLVNTGCPEALRRDTHALLDQLAPPCTPGP